MKIRTSDGTKYVDLDGVAQQGTSGWTLDQNSVDGTGDHYAMPLSWNRSTRQQVWSRACYPLGDDLWEEWDFRMSHPDGIAAGDRFLWGQPGLYVGLTRGTSDITSSVDDGWIRVDDYATQGPFPRLAVRYDVSFHFTRGDPVSTTWDGRIQFQDRDDITGPQPMSAVRAVRDGRLVRLRWTNPASPDFSRVIVRWHKSTRAPAVPTSGTAAYYGQGASASFAAPRHQPVTIAIWSLDRAANRARYVARLPAS